MVYATVPIGTTGFIRQTSFRQARRMERRADRQAQRFERLDADNSGGVSEAEYLAAFREFVTVGDSRDRIPAQTVEQIETGWAELQQVETALEDALALNPEDPFLNKRMLDLRAKQLGFLRQLAALDHSNRRLTI